MAFAREVFGLAAFSSHRLSFIAPISASMTALLLATRLSAPPAAQIDSNFLKLVLPKTVL